MPSVAQLLSNVTARERMRGIPGATESERVTIAGQPYVVKHINLARDWTVHAAGVLGAPVLAMWRAGLFDRLPPCISQPIVGVASEPGWTSVLMRDVSQWLVPSTNDAIPLEQHLRFVDHMAQLHATFWEGRDDIEVVPLMHRYLDLSPWLPIAERSICPDVRIPALVEEGWTRLTDVAPKAAQVVTPRPGIPTTCHGSRLHTGDLRARLPEVRQHGKRRRRPNRSVRLGASWPRPGVQ
jgi:hypothetical protein